MKIKDHLTLIVICAATIVLGIVGLYLVNSAQSGLLMAHQNLSGLQQRMEPLLRFTPFPSPENIKSIQRNQAQIQTVKKEFLDYFNNPDISKEDVEAITLRNQITSFRQEMSDLARKKNIALPKDFGFSFEMYGQVLPDNRNTEIMAKQLSTLQVLMPQLLDLNIQEIRSVNRAALTDEKMPTSKSAVLKIKENQELNLIELPFEITYIGDIDSLRDMINYMAESRNLFVVKDIIIKNHNLKVQNLPSFMTPEALEAQRKSSAPIIIHGLEKLQVTIRFDLLIFKNNETTAESKS